MSDLVFIFKGNPGSLNIIGQHRLLDLVLRMSKELSGRMFTWYAQDPELGRKEREREYDREWILVSLDQYSHLWVMMILPHGATSQIFCIPDICIMIHSSSKIMVVK